MADSTSLEVRHGWEAHIGGPWIGSWALRGLGCSTLGEVAHNLTVHGISELGKVKQDE